jgi:hypothetical protein
MDRHSLDLPVVVRLRSDDNRFCIRPSSPVQSFGTSIVPLKAAPESLVVPQLPRGVVQQPSSSRHLLLQASLTFGACIVAVSETNVGHAEATFLGGAFAGVSFWSSGVR